MLNNFFSSLIAFGIPLLFASVSQAAVWTATNTWNEESEQAFAKFINELPLDYFTREGMPYKGIETDCADAAYTLRVIFAYDHKLPVNFSNYEGKDLSNNNSQYDNVPEGRERVKAFIKLVRLNTDTGTLINETYPIAINRKSVRPGTMFLHSPKGDKTPAVYHSGHVFYVQNISPSGLVTYISSTVPIAVRNLNARNGLIFTPFNVDSGYRAWKWPDTKGQPLDQRLNGSTEQFKLAGWKTDVFLDGREALAEQMDNWSAAVRKRLQGTGSGKEINPIEELNAVLGNIKSGVNDRIGTVLKGWKYYQANYNGKGCMNESDYDDHSTPTRDTRIQQELQYLEPAATRYLTSRGSRNPERDLQKLYANYLFEVMPGVTIDLNQVVDAFLTKKALAISEPEHSPRVRWGLTTVLMKAQWACPHRASQYYGAETIN